MIDPSACPSNLIIRSPSKPTISSYFSGETNLWPQELAFLFYKQIVFKLSLICKACSF